MLVLGNLALKSGGRETTQMKPCLIKGQQLPGPSPLSGDLGPPDLGGQPAAEPVGRSCGSAARSVGIFTLGRFQLLVPCNSNRCQTANIAVCVHEKDRPGWFGKYG